MHSLLFRQISTLRMTRNWITYPKSVAKYLVRPKLMPAILFQSERVSMAYEFWLCSMEPHWFQLDPLNRRFAVNSLDLFRCIVQLWLFFPIVALLQHSNPLLKIVKRTINQSMFTFFIGFLFLHSQFSYLLTIFSCSTTKITLTSGWGPPCDSICIDEPITMVELRGWRRKGAKTYRKYTGKWFITNYK